MKVIHLDSCLGKADGVYDNTRILRTALESLRDAGGGRLALSPGVWRTGPITIYSGTTVYIDEGAVLSFIPEVERYQPVKTRWEGVECYAMHPCIFSSGQRDITIMGKGRIDGNGEFWWNLLRSKRQASQKEPETALERDLAGLNPEYRNQPGGGGGREIQFLRPPLIQFFECQNIRLEGVTISNSPFWTVHPIYCDEVVLSDITVTNPHDAPNTDGIDIDSCSNVLIENCNVTVGDDGIALKSGSGSDGIRVNRPTYGVTVRNCTIGDGHGGIVIGSETAAGVHDVLAEKCFFKGTDRGIRIKTRRGRGGDIYNLVFRNMVMEANLCPLAINMYYRCGSSSADTALFSTEKQETTASTPRIHDILVSNMRATGCRSSAAFLVGLPEAPIEGLVLENCTFSTDEESPSKPDESDMFLGIPSVTAKGIRILNVSEPVFKNCSVKGPLEAFLWY